MVRPAPHRLALAYQLTEDVVIGGCGWRRHIERWTVTVAGDHGERVGYAHVIILNLADGVEIADLIDAASGVWREPEAPRGATERGVAPVLGEHVLVLDRVFVEPGFRGAGLGPVVAALAMGRLGRGCRIAVCFPAPFDGPHPDDERDRSIAALGRIWATVGFRPRSDGVWVLNLDDDTLPVATDRLLGGGPHPAPRP